ncbi:hypothetical protein HK096_006040, partial [Nowakowskiella sp. JEL0078]
VLEETGFDISSYIDEENFVIRWIAKKTVFVTKTRKEIGIKQISGWSDSTTLERGRYYMVVPFMTGLKQWILKRRRVLKKSQKSNQKSSDLGTGSISGYKSGTDWEYKSSTDVDSDIEMSTSTIYPFRLHLIVPNSPERLSASNRQKSVLMQIPESKSILMSHENSTPTSFFDCSQSQQKHNFQLLNIKPCKLINILAPNIQPTSQTATDVSESIKSLLRIGASNYNFEIRLPVMSGPTAHQKFIQTVSSNEFMLSSFQHSPIFANNTPIPMVTIADEATSAHKDSLLAILKGVPKPPKAFPLSIKIIHAHGCF